MLAGGQHTPFPQSTGTRIPQLCLPPKSNPSARINNSCHRRSVSIFVQMTGSVSTWGRIHRAMEMNVLEGSDDSNTFILASSQRKCARICWQTIGGSSHHQGFETGRIWGCAATIMHRRLCQGLDFETKHREKQGLSPSTGNCLSWMFGKAYFLTTRAPRFQCWSCHCGVGCDWPTHTTPSPRVAGAVQTHLINGSISFEVHAYI